MSWLARSLANSLHIDENGHDKDHDQHQNDAVPLEEDEEEEPQSYLEPRFDNIELNNQNHIGNDNDNDNDDNQGRGVKEDLSELKETLARQLWGVASFLAPPVPPPPPPLPSSRRLELDREVKEELDRSGSGNELEEDEEYIDGSEHYSDDDVEDDAVGVTDEALAFAQNIAHHPETWLDFPISEDEEESEEFEISEAQYKHALAIEHFSPRLAALRIELCPAHMSEGYFWMVYFVLLHSRLNKHDADLLSTPQLVQARAMWMQELQKQTKQDTEDWFGRKTSFSQGSTYSPRTPCEGIDRDLSEDSHTRYTEPRSYHASTDFDAEKQTFECINKSVEDESEKELVNCPSNQVVFHDYDEEEDDDWVDDTADLEGYSASDAMVGHEDDVSFSDLEEDSNWTMPVKPK